MSSLPPSGNVTRAPTPACFIFSTHCGSNTAKAQTLSNPASRMPPSTAMVSIVPPEAQLS